jgi:hypothetical protein
MLKEWKIWLRRENPFPRQVGIGRKIVYSEEELMNRVLNGDVYVNVFAEWQREFCMFDTIFLDIDEHSDLSLGERLDVLMCKVEKVSESLEREGLVGRWYFTGNGFHCYIDFPMIRFWNRRVYSKTVRQFVYEILGDNEKNLIDFKVCGDSNRMARFPLTVHSKTGMKMVRIDPSMEIEKILENSFYGKCIGDMNYCNEWLGDYLEVLQKDVRIVDEEKRIEIDVELSKLDLPPCVRKGIEILLLTGELEHVWRFHIGAYLLRVMDRKLVEDIFAFANDYDELKTRRQLDSLEKYKPYACKNAAIFGICPYGLNFKKCPYYDLSSGWLGRLLPW